MPFSTSDGVRLWTATTGTASTEPTRPPVVILHGGPGLWDDHEVLAEMLDDLTVVHRFDQRGCGRSGPSDTQSMARSAQDVDELRAYFGHERIVVLGHSFGASLAMAYAASYGDHVAGVVYLDGVGVGDWRTAYHEERARRITPEQDARLEELSGRPRSQAEEIEFRALSWFTDHADRERAMEWAYASASVDLPINFAANRALGAVGRVPDDELTARAATIQAPVTFVHGDGDPRPAWAVRDLAEHVPNHTFHLIPDAGHSPWLEQPELVREVLRGAVR
ncbi:alpha/beta fold hydrolase [Kribbella sp. NPDC059898]|uniref:alpha/beta fold hydrolase n=1 Tax=Kribbella sp. NPDC059898 TaxID=3346995 RepID=UPI0036580125